MRGLRKKCIILGNWKKANADGTCRTFFPECAKNPAGGEYGYGIARLHWGPNAFYFHGGETPGYNSFIGYDPTNKVTLIVWTNLTVSLDQTPTANALMLKVLDKIYVVSPLPPEPASSKPATSETEKR